MNIIKLDAIDSTNDFLKDLSRKQTIENFSVVSAVNQTKGRGQMGSVWISDIGKNLTMSILIKEILFNPLQIFDLNIVIALSVIEVLEELNIPKLAIKWPNDIMSDTKKIGGILIENSFKTDSKIESVVGVGLNVNQIDFGLLPNASSLFVITNLEYSLDDIIFKLQFQIRNNCLNFLDNNSEDFWFKFHEKLFKIGIPMPFEDSHKNRFMGIIQGVSYDGRLQILLEDDSIESYGIKEITMLY